MHPTITHTKIKKGNLVMLRHGGTAISRSGTITRVDLLAVVISTAMDPEHKSQKKYVVRTENGLHETDNLYGELYPAQDLKFVSRLILTN